MVIFWDTHRAHTNYSSIEIDKWISHGIWLSQFVEHMNFGVEKEAARNYRMSILNNKLNNGVTRLKILNKLSDYHRSNIQVIASELNNRVFCFPHARFDQLQYYCQKLNEWNRRSKKLLAQNKKNCKIPTETMKRKMMQAMRWNWTREERKNNNNTQKHSYNSKWWK